MGTAYSTISNACYPSSSSNAATKSKSSGEEHNQTPFTNHGFSKSETQYLTQLRRVVCNASGGRPPRHHSDSDYSFTSLVWKCSNMLSLYAENIGQPSETLNAEDMERNLAQKFPEGMTTIANRSRHLETICKVNKFVGAMDSSLKGAFFDHSDASEDEDKEQFLEFVSNMIWRHGRGHNQKDTLNFLWNACQKHSNTKPENQASGNGDYILAKDVIEFCFFSATTMHYMLQNPSPDSYANVIDKGNISGENFITQSMTSSLLEYAIYCRTENNFGGYGTGTGFSTTQQTTSGGDPSRRAEKTVSRTEFSEWQRKVLPDLFFCSIVQFFHVLFFPPELSQQQLQTQHHHHHQQQQQFQTKGVFHQYAQPFFPILRSSKELSSRNGSSFIIPISSPVFGSNIDKSSSDDGGAESFCLTNSLSPAMFCFASISANKFGGKVRTYWNSLEYSPGRTIHVWTHLFTLGNNHMDYHIIAYQCKLHIIIITIDTVVQNIRRFPRRMDLPPT